MRTKWYKIELSRENKRLLRKMFFQKQEIKKIKKKIGIGESVLYRIVRENNWIKKRERYLLYLVKKAYRESMSVEEISKLAQIRSYAILGKIKRKYKIKTEKFNIHNKRMTEEIEKEMIKDYNNNLSSYKICKKYNFKTSKTVLDVLKKYNIERRSGAPITNYNVNYFKKIDSHDKAYILGLLLADGYVIREYKGIGIQLVEGDGYLLKRIASRLGESASVIHINCENKRKKARETGQRQFVNTKDMTRLVAYNSEIANDLKKLEVVRNKTYILRLPKIYKKYLGSLCRGIWDGDGTVGIAKSKNIWCQVVSASKIFLSDLQKNIPFQTTLQKPCKNGSVYTLRVSSGNKETKRFLRWIYKYKGDLYLERKYAKVQNQIS